MIEDGFKEYPHIPLIDSMKPTKRVLLGQRLFWTHKRDGQNVGIQICKGETLISSRNQEHAASDITAQVLKSPEFPLIVDLLHDNPEFIVYVEACREGVSVTRLDNYERDILYIFDIFSKKSHKYLPYVLVYQMAYHYKIPIVGLWAETRHVTEDSLDAMVEECLTYCKANHLEGMVIKGYEIPEDIAGYYKEYGDGIIMAKVKQDIPKREKLHNEKGEPQLPSCPDSEVWGAIAKVEADCGLTGDAGHDMPLIAKYVGLEQEKHLYSSPTRKLFSYWQDYLADMKEKNSKVKFTIEKIEGNPLDYLLKRAEKKDDDWKPNPKIMMPEYREKYLKNLAKEKKNLEGTTGKIE